MLLSLRFVNGQDWGGRLTVMVEYLVQENNGDDHGFLELRSIFFSSFISELVCKAARISCLIE
jgi:hypothetical protein